MIKRKYKNIKKVVNGIEFDSIKEANRYQELLLLQKACEIRNLKLQPEFILQDSFRLKKQTKRTELLNILQIFSIRILLLVK